MPIWTSDHQPASNVTRPVFASNAAMCRPGAEQVGELAAAQITAHCSVIFGSRDGSWLPQRKTVERGDRRRRDNDTLAETVERVQAAIVKVLDWDVTDSVGAYYCPEARSDRPPTVSCSQDAAALSFS